MRHYEVIFMVYPEHSDQVPGMIERYTQMIQADGGKIHRLEDWGRRHLAYPINKVHKAYYMLMNVEASQTVIDELVHHFRFTDAVMRHLVTRMPEAITEDSPIMKAQKASRGSRGGVHKPPSQSTNHGSGDDIAAQAPDNAQMVEKGEQALPNISQKTQES